MEISQLLKYVNIGSFAVLFIMTPVVSMQVINMSYSLTKGLKIIASFGVLALSTTFIREYYSDLWLTAIIAILALCLCVFLNPFRKRKYVILYSYSDGKVNGSGEFHILAEEEPDLESKNDTYHLRFEISRHVLEPSLDPKSITIEQIGKQKRSIDLDKS